MSACEIVLRLLVAWLILVASVVLLAFTLLKMTGSRCLSFRWLTSILLFLAFPTCFYGDVFGFIWYAGFGGGNAGSLCPNAHILTQIWEIFQLFFIGITVPIVLSFFFFFLLLSGIPVMYPLAYLVNLTNVEVSFSPYCSLPSATLTRLFQMPSLPANGLFLLFDKAHGLTSFLAFPWVHIPHCSKISAASLKIFFWMKSSLQEGIHSLSSFCISLWAILKKKKKTLSRQLKHFHVKKKYFSSFL